MVRSYTSSPVESDLLDTVIRAAHSGPSAGNTRSLELLVLTNEQVGSYWDVTLPREARASFPWPGLLIAPVLLIPYVDPDAYVDRYAEADKARTGLGDGIEAWSVPYWWVDGGAAAENVLLAAVGVGLGACLFGQFDNETAIRERFGVPAGRRAIGTISIGHANPDDDRPSASASRPRLARTHFGQWQPKEPRV